MSFFYKKPTDSFRYRDLTGIDQLSRDDILAILDRAEDYAQRLERGHFQSDLLRGKVILTLFFEDSTRTRTSFEIAAKRLGAEIVHWDVKTSSVNKGESFADTIQTLGAMKPDAVVIRHSEYGAPVTVTQMVDCPVINAGDSWREHPTQALLDALTLRRHFGGLDSLRVAICGDIAHSRVAASNMILLRKLGIEVHVVAPPALMPETFPAEDIRTFDNLEEGIKGCAAVMMLRNQKERMQSGLIESDAAFFAQYGLTRDKLEIASPQAVVMHPGPMNRGVEIDGALADDPDRSLILRQVENGVPTRMAVFDLLLTGRF
jgi:aspartate carbamoyltransferase catalytic subunit